MSPSGEHPREALQDLVLDRLESGHRAEVESHLASCEACRSELDGLVLLRRCLVRGSSGVKAPDSLRRRIGEALDAEQTAGVSPTPEQQGWPGWRLALAWGVPLLIVAVLATVFWPRPVALPALQESVAADYLVFKAGTMDLELRTADEAALERFFTERGIAFRTRVLDLRMMGWQLVGGRVHELADQTSAAFVYRTADGRYVLCQMYAGTIADLPSGAELRENDGIEFHIYRQGDVTLSFWQEGDVICVLASDIVAEELIQLAFAKAMKV